MDIEQIKRSCTKYAVVSFDIFDTLLKRDMRQPKDVFYFMEKRFTEGKHLENGFAQKRIEAERLARETAPGNEVSINEIYEHIDFPREESEIWKQRELVTEAALIHVNYFIKEIYDWCLSSGKTIYIVSDTYFPKEFLENLLKREGYTGYTKLFLSCEYREKKRTGALFSELLKEPELFSRSVIHIGDSRHADLIGPMKCGIRAIHLNRNQNNLIYLSPFKKKIRMEKGALLTFMNNRILRLNGRAQQIGYETIGPILLGFCQWIYNEYRNLTQTRQINFWFAARDMYLFEKVFRLLFLDKTNCQYIYLSRKSLRPILIHATRSFAEFCRVLPRGKHTVYRTIQDIGYKCDQIDGFDEKVCNKIVAPRKLYECNEVMKILDSSNMIEKEGKLARPALMYLEQNGFMDRDTLFVDVGWHGSTQYILNRIQTALGIKKKIFGLYFGCMDDTDEKIGEENYKAFYFNQKHLNRFEYGFKVFECLVSAAHGTTLGYREENGFSIPILGEPDNACKYIQDVQTGAMEFVTDIKQSILLNNIEFEAEVLAETFENMIFAPKKEEIISIGDLVYDQGRLASPKSIHEYLRHPSALIRDLRYAPWRIGFMYRLFKVRLPYGKIYSSVRRTYKKVCLKKCNRN